MQVSQIKRIFRPATVLLGCSVLAVATLSGCWSVTVYETGTADLRKFQTSVEFKEYISQQIESERSRYRWNVGAIDLDMTPPAEPQPSLSPLGTTAEGQARDSAGFSSTNIQESGVDESDIFKTDGTYFYFLDGHQLHIVRAVPADEMELMSTTDLQYSPQELYLRGETLVVLAGGRHPENQSSLTIVTILDVSDRSTPSTVTSIEVEGSSITSRLIGSKLHLVLSMWPSFPFGGEYVPVMLTDIDVLLPDATFRPEGGRARTENAINWSDLYYPVDRDGYHVTAVVTLDVDKPNTPIESTGVVANAGTVYVSTEALYLTDTDYNHSGDLREATDVYKFDLTEDGAVPAGTAIVPGRVLNRFSLGEYQGYLRIATTVGNVRSFGESGARNHVYVLGDVEDELAVVGKVEDIAPGERIYAARFLGERGFLVTFKKVDPLFTLDLSDPTSPQVVGELKVPGYSDYIHPLGENHLLTIGKDAYDMGDFAWYQGVQISVFDVTDFANPQLVDAEVVGVRGTESEALHNPHAFTYFAPAGMLAVPMTIAEDAGESPSDYGRRSFEGLCLFTIDPVEGVEMVSRVPTVATADLPPADWGWLGASSVWARGVFIDEFVYAVTSSSVQALPVNQPDALPIGLALDE